jgi:signal transduction histidine kinase
LDLHGTLQWIQALLFAGLGLAALGTYLRHRTRPAAYVATAFGALAFVTFGTRLVELIGGEPPELFGDARLAAIVAFPWLLAAFVWSFEGPLPRWLRGVGLATIVLAASPLLLAPIGSASERSTAASVFVAVLLLHWVLLVSASSVHLWRVGRGQRVVRARTRLLASGALVLAAALLLAGVLDATQRPALAIATASLSIVSALLFAAGVTPPGVLRFYWRQLPGRRMHEMQTTLVAAATPHEVAHAVTPVLGDTFGAGALCADATGTVVAHHRLDRVAAERIAEGLVAATEAPPGVQALEVDGWWIAVRSSPYAPVFGEDEETLLERFGLQFRLALQRAELFVAHEKDRLELERNSAEMQAMLVGLSHDLRSPAVTISTYAALLREARDDEDREQMIEGIVDSSAYLDRLVDGLLELSRIGRNEGEPEPVALGSVVEGVARRLSVTHPDLTVVVDDVLPTICVDRLRIEQVIDNLLGNAAKHGGRRDLTIRVSWHPRGGDGTLVFADDGRGVPEREREAVFGLFRRGSGAQASGSGVGLGLVRRIVESYGGRVAFAPSEVGARAEVELPAQLLQPAADRALAREVSRPPG